MDFIQELWIKITQKGVDHNVNPILFAVLYFGTIPPYMGSMVWAIKNHRKQKRIALPVFSTIFFFILPAIYVVIFGQNVAWWVYVIISFMIIYGIYSVITKLKAKFEASVKE